MNYDIYTDGACLDNGKPSARGGWSFVVCNSGTKDIQDKKFGKLRDSKQNNNRAELEAMVQALVHIDGHPMDSFKVYTDYEVLFKGMTGTAERRANRDLWDEIEYLCAKNIKNNRINVFHVKEDKKNKDMSLVKIIMNNVADEMAKIGANSLLIEPIKPIKLEGSVY